MLILCSRYFFEYDIIQVIYYSIKEENDDMAGKKFYVTTPIYYPSGDPHLGHSYCTIAADTVARYRRMQGYDVMFLTGTDEHGQKIEINASKIGKTPQQYVDEITGKFKSLWETLNISYNKFIRTTDELHKKSVQSIFKQLYDKGKIYKGKYKGWYCTPCEAFFTDSQLKDGKCPDCGRVVQWAEEEAYFFKLSEYGDKLLEYYDKHPRFIQPESCKNEMVRFIKGGLEDLCVSRTSFSWGIPVEFDKKHVVYVWLDALTNYITSQGYGTDDDSDFKKYWPADVHFVGKEIARFHVIIWPAILMALELPLPKQVYGHGWILYGDGSKMSKSRGNVIDPKLLATRYGVDALRYFLLREFSFGNDGLFTDEALIKRINFDLANDLGNLLSRTVTMISKYFGGVIPKEQKIGNIDNELIVSAMNIVKKYELKMDIYHFSSALSEIWLFISQCNKYIDETMPWKLGNDSQKTDRLAAVLCNLREALRIISVMISPIMPETSVKIQHQIGVSQEFCTLESIKNWGNFNPDTPVKKGDILFPRIDIKKEIEELGELLENTNKKSSFKEDSKVKIQNENIIRLIDIEDFAKIKLVVAKIKECELVKNSKKLLKLLINDGEKNRIVVSGISQYYSPEQLINRNVILVSNLKPVKLCGVESSGMVLAAENSDKNVKVIFVDEMEPGSKIR